MKNAIKKTIFSVIAFAVLFASNTSMVEAKELNANAGILYEQSADAVARATQDYMVPFDTVEPGHTFYYIGEAVVGAS